MSKGGSLGKLDRENLKKVTRRMIEKILKPNTHGLSYLEDYQKGRERGTRAYGYLNALGNAYGYALAEAYLEDFLKAEEPDEAARAAEQAVPLMESMINEVMERATPMDVALARQALMEVGDRLPAGDPPEDMILAGIEYRDGMYLRDLSYSVAGALQVAMHAAENFLAWHKTPYSVSFDPEEMLYVPDLFQEPSRDELKRALKVANDEVKKRTYYGYHTVELPKHPNFTILGWSNGSETWHISWGLIEPAVRQVSLRGGGPLSLDANYILVPVHPKIMETVLPELDPLPLYDYSFEAKIRGRYPHADDRVVRKVLRAIIDAEMPKEDPEERAIMAINLWDVFVKAKQGFPDAQRAVEQFFLSLEQPAVAYVKILDDWLGTEA